MAPHPLDQKRKRGRPPGASKPTKDAPSRDRSKDNHDDAEEESRPKKRGRKILEDDMAANADLKGFVKPTQPGKLGRPAKSKTQTPEDEGEGEDEVQRKNATQKPGDTINAKSRSEKSQARALEGQVDQDPPSSELRRSHRERRTYNPEDMYSARRPNQSPTQFTSPPFDSSRMLLPTQRTKKSERDSTPQQKSRRERRAQDADKSSRAGRQSVEEPTESSALGRKPMNNAKGETLVNAPRESAGPKAQKPRAKSQNVAMEKNRRVPREESPRKGSSKVSSGEKRKKKQDEATTVDAAQPRRRGRPKRSDPEAQKPETSEPSRSRKRTVQARDEQEEQAPAMSNRKPLQMRQNPDEVVEEDNSESDEEDNTLSFRYLKEITRNIQRSTISDKWTPLDATSIDAVSNFLADAQRPVLMRLQNTNQRRGHASSALGVVIRRLRSRLVKGVPFPAPTAAASTRSNAASHEHDFDFERIVDAMQTLEHTLNPLLHSVSLLEREIYREEDALARDYDNLHHLETNAKAEAREWRDKMRRGHVLAPGLKSKREQEAASRDRLELVPAVEDSSWGGLFKQLEDEELVTLSKQIGSHMESMKGNLQAIAGVLPAITKSKAALQQVLLKHLDEEKYESVLLG